MASKFGERRQQETSIESTASEKRAARIISRLGTRASCNDYFPRQKILTIVGLYTKDKKLLQQGHVIHGHNTHQISTCPQHHTRQFEKEPAHMGRKLFNLLPEDVTTFQGKTLKKAPI